MPGSYSTSCIAPAGARPFGACVPTSHEVGYNMPSLPRLELYETGPPRQASIGLPEATARNEETEEKRAGWIMISRMKTTVQCSGFLRSGFLLFVALMFAAVYMLFRGIAGFKDGVTDIHDWNFLKQIFAVAALLWGITVAYRVPRLVANPILWMTVGATAFMAGAVIYSYCGQDVTREIHYAVHRIVPVPTDIGDEVRKYNNLWELVFAAAIVAFGALLSQLKPRLGNLPLILTGALIICGIVYYEEAYSHPAIWPVLIGGAMFIYLWWLAALLFDLVFIWQRYIRTSLGLRCVREIRRFVDEKPVEAEGKVPVLPSV